MKKADSLSRRPDWKIEIKKDNKNKVLVELELLETRVIE